MAAKRTSSKKKAARTSKKAAARTKTRKKTARTSSKKKTARTPSKKKTARTSSKKKARTKSKKKAARSSSKKKAAPKKPAPKKKSAKASPKKKPPAKPEPAKQEPQSEPDNSKSGRKGITIVQKKTVRRSAPKTPTQMPTFGKGLGSLAKNRRPLIPSGPNVAAAAALQNNDDGKGRKKKSPFTKRELDKFKAILIEKIQALLGDVTTMENEALLGSSGSLSHLPQHLAEQGSDAYDQMLSLDLAAKDRKLIKEIADALDRIENRTYGLCEMTGEPIGKERLTELPWARYSIAAAREMERRQPNP